MSREVARKLAKALLLMHIKKAGHLTKQEEQREVSHQSDDTTAPNDLDPIFVDVYDDATAHPLAERAVDPDVEIESAPESLGVRAIETPRSIGLDSMHSLNVFAETCQNWQKSCTVLLFVRGHEPCDAIWPRWVARTRTNHEACFAHLECSACMEEAKLELGTTTFPTIVRIDESGERLMRPSNTEDDEHDETRLSGPGNVRHLIANASPNNKVVVGFFAHWCGFCKDMLPKWEEAKTSEAARLAKWCTMDCTDQSSPASSLFNELRLRGFPSILLFDGGEPKVFQNRADSNASDLVRFAL